MATVHSEEAARAAAFGRAVAVLCLVGVFLLLIRQHDEVYRLIVGTTAALLGCVGAWVWYRSRDPARYSRNVFRFFGIASAVAALVFIFAVGVFSPMPAVVVLGFAFFGQAEDKQIIYPVAIGVVVVYTIAAVLISLDIVPDPGVFKAVSSAAPQARLSVGLVISTTMAIALVQASSSRRTMLDALARSNEAIRVAQTREAQLAEARENLDVAARARGGRLTGAVLSGFRLGEIVGRGAMGEVYAAEHEASGRPAAIKVLRRGESEDDIIAARFEREAEIASKVRGPNLVEVYSAGTAEDGSFFIAMELLRGRDLAAILRDREILPLPEAVTLIDHAARGLEVLHEAGVIHRDLKPQNLFLSDGPPQRWKILDYGVSKLIGASTMTEAMLVGTPGYMSPEQAEGNARIDARSDVFALGVIAYRIVTGRRPFTGPDTPQILYQVVHGEPVRPRELAPSLPQEVEAAIGVALAKRAEDRWASPSDFAAAFRSAAMGVRARAPSRKGPRTWRREPTTLTMPRIAASDHEE